MAEEVDEVLGDEGVDPDRVVVRAPEQAEQGRLDPTAQEINPSIATTVAAIACGGGAFSSRPRAECQPRVLSKAAVRIGCLLEHVDAEHAESGAGWAFLPPLPFYPAGQWSVWSESLFFVGNLLVGAGFCVFCIDVLEQTTNTYGGLARTLGWHYLRGREEKAPPPQAIAATVVAIDGLISCAVGSTILLGLLGRTYDHTVGIDALVAKNLVYFFGHSIANLTIYLAAAVVYVLVPRYAGRPYETTKVFVAGWTGSLIFIATAYSHHLYMDFVQPVWADIISEVASYGALLPVAVITIYSMTMLIWGSRYQWTLASTLLYIGFAGWAIGGVGAVIDSLIPINFRLHNTTWVVAHFHTYLILCVVVWAVAFLAHLLERDAGRTSSRAATAWTVALILVGGYGLTGTWFVEGALGIPRRYAIQPSGTSGYSIVGASFALLLALGFLSLFIQLITARPQRMGAAPRLSARRAYGQLDGDPLPDARDVSRKRRSARGSSSRP